MSQTIHPFDEIAATIEVLPALQDATLMRIRQLMVEAVPAPAPAPLVELVDAFFSALEAFGDGQGDPNRVARRRQDLLLMLLTVRRAANDATQESRH